MYVNTRCSKSMFFQALEFCSLCSSALAIIFYEAIHLWFHPLLTYSMFRKDREWEGQRPCVITEGIMTSHHGPMVLKTGFCFCLNVLFFITIPLGYYNFTGVLWGKVSQVYLLFCLIGQLFVHLAYYTD